MKRQIIKIDEQKCNGCGLCVPNCPEGALQIIDGKARLISDLFCDGLGACLGECPEKAIKIEEREAEAYNETIVMGNIVKQGANTIKAHLKHLKDHNEIGLLTEAINYLKEHNMTIPELDEAHSPCGCPGSKMKVIERNTSNDDNSHINLQSELRQWPTQLQLLNPNAPYFQNANLLVCADCVPFAYPNFHNDLLKDKIVVMFCPKLDSTIDLYVEKLVNIFENNDIQSVTIARMEVPCCGGTESILRKALEMSEKDVSVDVKIINIDGTII